MGLDDQFCLHPVPLGGELIVRGATGLIVRDWMGLGWGHPVPELIVGGAAWLIVRDWMRLE